jgi:hypothetical protein
LVTRTYEVRATVTLRVAAYDYGESCVRGQRLRAMLRAVFEQDGFEVEMGEPKAPKLVDRSDRGRKKLSLSDPAE